MICIASATQAREVAAILKPLAIACDYMSAFVTARAALPETRVETLIALRSSLN